MPEFVRRAVRNPECVGLEVVAKGGALAASVKPPQGAPHVVGFRDVPLLTGVKQAKLMADLLGTDVTVVDPLGVWHEWLVGWACGPLGSSDSGQDAGGHAGLSEFTGSRPTILHAPSL